MFEYILEYLRDQNQKYQGEFQLPQDEKTLRALLREAEFYQLPSLVTRVNKAVDSLADSVSAPMDALVCVFVQCPSISCELCVLSISLILWGYACFEELRGIVQVKSV